MPLTDQGFTPYTIAELRARLRSVYEGETGEVPNWAEDRFLGAFSEAVLSVAVLPGQLAQAVYDATSIDNARGRLLENLAELSGLERQGETFSEANITVTGTNGTVIQAGKIVRNTANDSRWVIQDDITISGGTGSGTVQAETAGRIEGPSSAAIEIVTPVSGWDTVSFDADAELGSDEETEGSLRARIRRRKSAGGAATVPAIESALEGLSFVDRAVVIVNPSESTLTTSSGVDIEPRGILVVLDTDLLTTEDEETLAEAMFETIGATTNTEGSDNTVTHVYRGRSYDFTYNDATETSVTVAATLVLDSGFSISDIDDQADQAVADYFTTLTIGDDVTLLGIYRALGSVEGILSATFTLNGGSSDVSIGLEEIGVYDSTGSSYTV